MSLPGKSFRFRFAGFTALLLLAASFSVSAFAAETGPYAGSALQQKNQIRDQFSTIANLEAAQRFLHWTIPILCAADAVALTAVAVSDTVKSAVQQKNAYGQTRSFYRKAFSAEESLAGYSCKQAQSRLDEINLALAQKRMDHPVRHFHKVNKQVMQGYEAGEEIRATQMNLEARGARQ